MGFVGEQDLVPEHSPIDRMTLAIQDIRDQILSSILLSPYLNDCNNCTYLLPVSKRPSSVNPRLARRALAIPKLMSKVVTSYYFNLKYPETEVEELFPFDL